MEGAGFFEMYEKLDQLTEDRNFTSNNKDDVINSTRGFFYSENMLSKTPGLGTSSDSLNESSIYSHAPLLQPRRSLHKRTIRSNRREFMDNPSAGWSYFPGVGSASLRNHPAAPPNRYTCYTQRHYKRQIWKRTYSHHNFNQENKQIGYTTRKETANSSRLDQLHFRGSATSGCLSSGTTYKGIPLRNVPTAPSPYITQIKHNEKTSRYIAQLAQKATKCKMKCSDNSDPNAEENKTCLLLENSDSSLETFLPYCRNEDRSPCASFGSSSPEQQYIFKKSFSKPTREHFSQHSSKVLNKEPIKDSISLALDNREKEDYLLSGLMQDRKLLTDISDKDIEIAVCSASPKEEESKNTNQRKTLLQYSSEKSSQDDPELPRYLPKQQDDNMDVTPEKIEEPCEEEEEETEGLKMDVSFSFVEKGGYHPIALPLGCHIYEDDSNSSDNEMESVSVLERRMSKMGRDEYNLNVDKSSSFMPWILIPLDDVPKVNYENLKLDPRLQKLLKDDSLIGETNYHAPSSCEMQIPYECAQTVLADVSNDDPSEPVVENLNFQKIQNSLEDSTFDMLQRTVQGSEENLLDIMDISFTESFLKETADSVKLSDKILDSLSEETEALELEQGLLQQDVCNKDANPTELILFDENKNSDTPVNDGKISSPVSTSLMDNFQADAKEVFTKTDFHSHDTKSEQREASSTNDTCNREITPDNEGFSNSFEIRELPRSTMQLLKETYTFLKDQNLSKRGIKRRHRRVSTSLRVADYALPNFLEEFYVESESYNYAEQSAICCDKSLANKSAAIMPSESIPVVEKKDFQDDVKKEIKMPRRSKRRANLNSAMVVSGDNSKLCVNPSLQKGRALGKQTLEKKGSKLTASVKESLEKQSSMEKIHQEVRDKDLKTRSAGIGENAFIIQFEGKKYQCNQGILTLVDSKKIHSVSKLTAKSGTSCNDYDQNPSKTVHTAKMKNSVLKRSLKNRNNNTLSQNSAKKVKPSNSPKVMVQNCLQAISVSSSPKTSKKVTTKKSRRIEIIKKTATVKKELFPVKNNNKNSKSDSVKSTGLKNQKKILKGNLEKEDGLVKKGCNVVKQTLSSTKSLKSKTEEKRSTGKVFKPKTENSTLKKEGKKLCDLKSKSVKPIIRIHQGLRNTSLKKFKAQHYGKLDLPFLTKKIIQKECQCSHCERSFTKVSQLEKHIKEDHHCLKCDLMLDSKVAKQKHFYFCHATEVHVCLTCKKKYSQAYHLRKHFESLSHKELIKHLLREIKKVTKGLSVISRSTSSAEAYSKPINFTGKALDESSNLTVAKYDHFAQTRSRRKLKFMETESIFFNANPDLLELIHKIDYIDGENDIVKHYLYKDPELAEVQSCIKKESHDSYYEEIEIINEYSITSHCENFLEDQSPHLAFSHIGSSSEPKYNEAITSSEYTKQDQRWSTSCHHLNNCQDIALKQGTPSKFSVETDSNSNVLGWFSAAMDTVEQRNLEDDSTYSTYLGMFNNECKQEPAMISNTLQTFNESTQIISSQASLSTPHQSLMMVPNSYPYERLHGDYPASTLVIPEDVNSLPFVTDASKTSLQTPKVSSDRDRSLYSRQDINWEPAREEENALLDTAQSLILLSKLGVPPTEDDLSKSPTSIGIEDCIQKEWESICSEIEKDVQEY